MQNAAPLPLANSITRLVLTIVTSSGYLMPPKRQWNHRGPESSMGCTAKEVSSMKSEYFLGIDSTLL